MQKEAEQRVREMQSRARLVGGENSPSPEPQRKNSSPQNFIHQNPTPARDPFSAVIGNLDSDRIIILALLWLLWNEHADSKLLMALLYLLL
ncbi:MAG: hypothetical protein IJ306_10885 [Oscillospiraceae bacterium]|nr:hypothetical protein [Oscillospiraceae bacterium]